MKEEDQSIANKLQEKLSNLCIDTAVIKTQVDAIFKKQDELWIKVKDELSRMRESYTRAVTNVEKDNAEFRNEQREVNKELFCKIDDINKRINDLGNENLISKTKLGFIILLLSTVIGVIVQWIWSIITK